MNEKIQSLNNTISEKNNTIDELNRTISDSKTKMTQHEEKISQLNNKIIELLNSNASNEMLNQQLEEKENDVLLIINYLLLYIVGKDSIRIRSKSNYHSNII